MKLTLKLGLWLIACLALAMVGASTARAQEVTVRGKVERDVKEPTKPPAPYIRVALVPKNGGGRSRVSYTDAQGMYYFQKTERGTYVLKVWGDDKETKLLFEQDYQVAPKEAGGRYFDIKTILIP